MTEPSRNSRSDATRNRSLLLTAARAVVAETGVGTPLSVVANRAGLATATLYRHFPSRDHLLAAVYEAETERCRTLLNQASTSEDALDGLLQAMRAFADLEVRSPGFSVTLVEPEEGATRSSPAAAEAMARLGDLVRRARQRADVHADLTLDDVIVAIASIRSVSTLDRSRAATRSRRIIDLFHRGITL